MFTLFSVSVWKCNSVDIADKNQLTGLLVLNPRPFDQSILRFFNTDNEQRKTSLYSHVQGVRGYGCLSSMEPLIFAECKVHRSPQSPSSLPILFTWGALASEDDGAVSVLGWYLHCGFKLYHNHINLASKLLTQLHKKKRQFTFIKDKMTRISLSQRNAPTKGTGH